MREGRRYSRVIDTIGLGPEIGGAYRGDNLHLLGFKGV